jgi:hypothetical protein
LVEDLYVFEIDIVFKSDAIEILCSAIGNSVHDDYLLINAQNWSENRHPGFQIHQNASKSRIPAFCSLMRIRQREVPILAR